MALDAKSDFEHPASGWIAIAGENRHPRACSCWSLSIDVRRTPRSFDVRRLMFCRAYAASLSSARMLVYGVINPYSRPSSRILARFSSVPAPLPNRRRVYSAAHRRGAIPVTAPFSSSSAYCASNG